MRALQALFGLMWAVGALGNGILFLYVQWLYLRESFVQIFNPFLQIQVVISMLQMPLFWILLALAVVGYFAAQGVEKQVEDSRRASVAPQGPR